MRCLALVAAWTWALVAVPVAASDEGRPAPALMTGHLRIAAQACLEAADRLPEAGGSSAGWAAEPLGRAGSHLRIARENTADPREHARLDRLAAEAAAIRADLRSHSGGAVRRLVRLRSEIRRLADEVQGRIDLRQPDPAPAVRPALGP